MSPERTPTLICGAGCPCRSAMRVMPVSGVRRLRSTSTASAFSGDTYRTRVPAPAGRGSAASRSIAHRNAASVLPDPVGAMTSVLSPSAMADQACACASVGAAKVPVNHSAGQRAEPGERVLGGAHVTIVPTGTDKRQRSGTARRYNWAMIWAHAVVLGASMAGLLAARVPWAADAVPRGDRGGTR